MPERLGLLEFGLLLVPSAIILPVLVNIKEYDDTFGRLDETGVDDKIRNPFYSCFTYIGRALAQRKFRKSHLPFA